MSKQAGVTVVDAVSEARYEATFSLMTLFKTTSLSSMAAWVPVMCALQEMPKQIIDEVGIPIIKRFFEEESLNPEKDQDRDVLVPFIPLLLGSISTATNVVYANMQRQAEARVQQRSKIIGAR